MDIQQPLAVTVDVAADLLSVSRRTIYRLAKAGRLRIVRITSDSPRVMMADINAFLASGRDGDGQATEEASGKA